MRDQQRPAFHKALGVDPTWYGYEVYKRTSATSKQVFPLTLDIDHPRWQPGLDRLQAANIQIAAGRAQDGVPGWVKRLVGSTRAAMAFISLLTIRSIPNTAPASARMEPVY